MSANFWFASAKVVNYFELRKKKSLKKRFFVFIVQFSLLICQNHAPPSAMQLMVILHGSERNCACIVRVLCVNST